MLIKKYRQLIVGICIGGMLFSIAPIKAAIEEYICYKADYKVMVNGKEYKDPDLPILNYKGSTYAPFRSILESAGLEVNWNAELGMAEVTTPIVQPGEITEQGETTPEPTQESNITPEQIPETIEPEPKLEPEPTVISENPVDPSTDPTMGSCIYLAKESGYQIDIKYGFNVFIKNNIEYISWYELVTKYQDTNYVFLHMINSNYGYFINDRSIKDGPSTILKNIPVTKDGMLEYQYYIDNILPILK